MKNLYYSDNLAPRGKKIHYAQVQLTNPLEDWVVEDVATGFCGAIIAIEKAPGGPWLRLEDAQGVTRIFALRPGAFAIDGKPVTLVAPQVNTVVARSHSGSTRAEGGRAKVAAASRIWVEGIHDAALVEKIWGHDLRQEGIVVEPLSGLDGLHEKLAEFGPHAGAKVGVLVDHLVPGSKESRIVADVGEYVMVTGHPYVDIWQAVKPAVVGITAWPNVSRGTDWKTGVCAQLGWGSPQEGWHRVYSSVRSYRDVESELIGAVERLIDFVTVEGLEV